MVKVATDDDGNGTAHIERLDSLTSNLSGGFSPLDIASKVILVEGGTDEELIAVHAWATELFQAEIAVVDYAEGRNLATPPEIIQDILGDWDKRIISGFGTTLEVRSVDDIVDWYRA